MPTTRKKVIKTVYKDEDDSEPEQTGDFSDSGSDAKITDQSSSEEDQADSSGEEFEEEVQRNSNKFSSKFKKPEAKKIVRKTPQIAKTFLVKLRKVPSANEIVPEAPAISVKDLTDADKLLPSFLDLSESDSSDDESTIKPRTASTNASITSITSANGPGSDDETKMEYQDVWSNNVPDNSEEIALKTFKELELHKTEIEQTKASILNYTAKSSNEGVSDVKDLLAQGEEVVPEPVGSKKKTRKKKLKNDSDSELEDWEEVQESKALPASGLQVVVDFPDAAISRKSKKLDIEMMMKRKMNRVKKEYQVYMHKVHVLCWLGHGNYVSSVLNNQEILSAVLTLVPSKECYPGERVDVKYVEQITKWFNKKLTFKQDKNEHKFRPKAPPLKDIMLKEIKSKVVSTKKYMVYIFVSILRALGLQCRVMFNFVTLPIKPPSSELCSLSTKDKDEITKVEVKKGDTKKSAKKRGTSKKKGANNISQVDGNDDSDYIMQVDGQDDRDLYIMQVDGNDDNDLVTQKGRKTRLTRARKVVENTDKDNEDVSPPKRAKKDTNSNPPKPAESTTLTQTKRRNRKASEEASKPQAIKGNIKSETIKNVGASPRTLSLNRRRNPKGIIAEEISGDKSSPKPDPLPTKNVTKNNSSKQTKNAPQTKTQNKPEPPNIVVTDENNKAVTSSFFENSSKATPAKSTGRTRSRTTNYKGAQSGKSLFGMSRSKSTGSKSFFDVKQSIANASKTSMKPTKVADPEDNLRVSHRDVLAKTKATSKNDVKADLITIMKTHLGEDIEEQRETGRKAMKKSEDDSDYQPDAMSDDDFKPTKISPKPSTSRKIDRRVISTDDEAPKHKTDVWCEVYVEELEQWIAVDVMKGQVHCTNEIYNRSTHPVCYVVGWDNNNYLKDLTRRYVPAWNTVTRKQRAEPAWWGAAAAPWRGPRSARDKEEDEALDRLQLDAPLPKSIAEYKNHPLYALERHLLKFEAIYPPDAAVLGFVRNEAVYARECVYICRSRDTWLKEAKVVRLGEKPYKIVKARPKWDKLSNKCITDKPLEVFGPWQVQEYEPPVAENGVVPRNAYGNVELFKECMLPKGTAHVKLPGLNRVAKKLNIDCAPAMTGFDFNGGWSHPVYDGYVVCKEFEEIITEAWLKDQEEQERREREKTDSRVYGNWKRLIKGLMIRERLKAKYGFEEPSTSANAKKPKGPRRRPRNRRNMIALNQNSFNTNHLILRVKS